MNGEDMERCDNSCRNATLDLFQNDPHNLVGKVGVVLISIMICAGAIGNLVVLLAVVKCPKLQKSYNFIIAALAITDLTFNTVIMPFYADTFLTRRWRYSAVFCKFNTFLGTMVVMASGLHIGLIALNRYVLIVLPHLYQSIACKRAIACQIAFIWLLSFLTVLPGILGWNAVVEYSDQIGRCNYVRSESKLSLYFIFGIGFFLPCIMMAFAYIQVYLAIHHSRKTMMHYDGTTPAQTTRRRESYLRIPLILAHTNRSPASAVHSNNETGNNVTDGCHTDRHNQIDSIQCAGDNRPVHKGGRPNAKGSNTLDAKARKEHDNNETVNNDKLHLLARNATSKPTTYGKRQISMERLELNNLQPQRDNSSSANISPCAPLPSVPASPAGQNPTESDWCSNQPSPRPHLDSTTERLHKRDVHLVHMIFILFLAFALTYLPFTILNTVDQAGEFGREWYMLTSLAFWAGASINPWIYGIMNKQFRDAYRELLCQCRRGN